MHLRQTILWSISDHPIYVLSLQILAGYVHVAGIG